MKAFFSYFTPVYKQDTLEKWVYPAINHKNTFQETILLAKAFKLSESPADAVYKTVFTHRIISFKKRAENAEILNPLNAPDRDLLRCVSIFRKW